MTTAYEKKVVQHLDPLNQSLFPALPEGLPDGCALMVFGSPLRKAEKETVLAIIATLSIRAKQWIPVAAVSFSGFLKGASPIISPQAIINQVWEMAGDGLLDIIRDESQSMDYVVIKPALAEMLAESKLRYIQQTP